MNAWKIKTDNYAAADYGHPANNPAAAFRFAGIAQTGQKRLPSAVWQEIDDNRKLKTSTFAFARELLSSECISRHDGKYVVNSFLPPFPGRAYERMFTNLLSGRKLSPVSAYIAVTKECPYNCWHCSFKGHVKPDLPTSRQLVLTDDLCRLGASIIGFTGGEPLQHKNIADLIKRAEPAVRPLYCSQPVAGLTRNGRGN